LLDHIDCDTEAARAVKDILIYSEHMTKKHI
jgi:hypothetical protein